MKIPSIRAAPVLGLRRARRWTAGAEVRRLALGLGFLAVTAALFSSAFVPERVDVSLGQPAREAIKAPRDFVDVPTTRRLQQEAMDRIPDSYTLDPSVTEDVMSGVRSTLAAITALRASQEDDALRVAALRKAVAFDVSDEEASAVLRLDDATWQGLAGRITGLVLAEMNKGVQPQSLETFKRDAAAEVATWNQPAQVASFAQAFVQAALRPNVLFDAAKTQAARAAARALVKPVTIVKGQTIVADGNIVTADDMERLRDAGLLRSSRDLLTIVAAVLVAALLEVLVALHLVFFKPDLWRDTRRLLLVALILAVVLAVDRAVAPVSGYLSPVAWTGMLAAILIGPELGLIAVVYEATGAGFLAGHDLRFAFVGLAGGFAAVFSVRRVDQRGDIMRGGFFAAAVNALAVVTVSLVGGVEPFGMAFWREVAFGALNGVASGVLTIGSLPYAEQLFDVLTSVRLLELSNPNHPLLRRLLLEAPGTYHHSLMVANLCEAAAEAVGANPLLARVGAYYHDIGKLKRPYFFADNQFGGENPHDSLSPSLSALIVISHVRDGLDLAREYRLPERITHFIPEHHGTMLASFFYQKACEQSDEPVDESAFRYPGPLPQSKEAAIMMLADGTEASVRAIKEPTPDRIEAQVRRIIKDRLDTGQLDQADVTLKDLDTIARSFTHVLIGFHHQRIQYPESIADEIRRGREKGERRRERHGFLRAAGRR